MKDLEVFHIGWKEWLVLIVTFLLAIITPLLGSAGDFTQSDEDQEVKTLLVESHE